MTSSTGHVYTRAADMRSAMPRCVHVQPIVEREKKNREEGVERNLPRTLQRERGNQEKKGEGETKRGEKRRRQKEERTMEREGQKRDKAQLFTRPCPPLFLFLAAVVCGARV